MNGDNSDCSEDNKPKVESKENQETEKSTPLAAESSSISTASTITTSTPSNTTTTTTTEEAIMSASGRTREHHSSPKQGALCPDPSQLFAAAAAAFPFNPFGSAGANPNAWMDIQRAISAAANAQSKLFQPQRPHESRSSPGNRHSPLQPTSSSRSEQKEPKSKSHHDLPLDLSAATTISATPTTNSVKMSSGHKSSKENTHITSSSSTTPTSAMLAASAVANAARKVNNFSNSGNSPAFPPLADHLKSLGAIQPGAFNGFDPTALAAAYGFDPTAFFAGASNRPAVNPYASLGGKVANGASPVGGSNGFMTSILDQQQALLASLGAAKVPHYTPSRPTPPTASGNTFLDSFYSRMQQFLEQSQKPSVNHHLSPQQHQSSPKLSSPKSGHNSPFNHSSGQLPPYSSGAAFPTPSRGSAFSPATPSAVFPTSGHHQQQQQSAAAPAQSAFADFMRMSSRNGRPSDVSISPAAAVERMRHSSGGPGRPSHHLTNGNRPLPPHGKERRTDSRYKCGYCYKVIHSFKLYIFY